MTAAAPLRVAGVCSMVWCLLALGVPTSGPAPARAAETQWWITDSAPDLAKSEARGLVVHADGSIGLGPESRVSTVDSLGVIWAIAVLSDGSVAIAGDKGRIDRWTESGGVKPWVRLPVAQARG